MPAYSRLYSNATGHPWTPLSLARHLLTKRQLYPHPKCCTRLLLLLLLMCRSIIRRVNDRIAVKSALSFKQPAIGRESNIAAVGPRIQCSWPYQKNDSTWHSYNGLNGRATVISPISRTCFHFGTNGTETNSHTLAATIYTHFSLSLSIHL